MVDFNYGIVGSGPAGYTAALDAASLGNTVVLFEKDLIGGTCLNKGCIPTKTLLHCAEIYENTLNSECFGITVDNCSLNFEKIAERKNEIVEKLRNGLTKILQSNKITIVNSEAKIIDKNTINADGKTYICKKIISAVGSSPKEIKGFEYDGKFILSSDDVLNFTKLPKSMLIVGSGAIGIEFSRIFSAFGVEITLIEMADNLLPVADIEISKRIERIFKTKGLRFCTKTSIKNITKNKNDVTAKLSNDEVINAECVLFAVGRQANKTEKIDGVKYIGDIENKIQLAHYASKSSMEEILNIPFERELVPSVVYGTPEIAWVGKREQDLEGEEYQKSMIPISALAKSQCDGATDGMIKILVQNNKIVGAHIISNEASSLIQQFVIAMQANVDIDKLKCVCFAHPTYSEGILDCIMRLK
mgnify:CR=1 FL=1